MSALEANVTCSASPDLAATWYDRGVSEVKAGNIEEAFDAFKRVLQLEPESAPANNGLGICLHFMGKRDEAADAYQKAAQLDSRFAKALHVTLMDRLATLYRHKLLRQSAGCPTPAKDTDDDDDE